MNFKVKKSEIIFKGKVFDVQVDEIEYNGSGNRGIREVAVHPGGAVIVPVKQDGKIIFVKQFRYPSQEILLELPAGKLDPDEAPRVCAERELKEETGLTTNKIEKLGYIYTSPGFCSEKLHIYLAEELEDGDYDREEGEYGMEVIELSLNEAEQKILSGEIVDGKTLSGIYQYKLRFNR